MIRLICTVLTVMILHISGWSHTYYVSMKGNDNNAGTPDKPFKSIQRAANTMIAGDTCLIEPGIYYETLTPQNNGTQKQPIVLEAATTDPVTISGTAPVHEWTLHKNRIYKSKVEWTLGSGNQLFCDGEMMTECRWPNKQDPDVMKPEAARVEGGDTSFIICTDFPTHFSTENLKDAMVWALVQSKWSSWTSRVTSFDGTSNTVHFDNAGDSWLIKERHNPGKINERYGAGEFFLSDAYVLLDAPGEWYFDDKENVLYFWPPDNRTPEHHKIEFKKRKVAIDLTDKKYIHINGINVRGASIKLKNSESCKIESVKASYLFHDRNVDSRPLSEPTSGVYISGIGNVIRDSEIVYSSASNIVLEGTRNAIINCLVHKANYLGTWNALVRYDGIGHLISHNTLKNSGRSCIRPGGAEHLIQYNHISDPGMITHDLGCYHGGGNDGGNCIIRYNRFRGIAGKEYNGIYLDNYMHNFIIHHNVVSRTNDAIRLNRPTHYCVIAHNTVMEGITNRWGPWKGQMTQFGSLVVNNILGGPLMLNPEVVQARNLPVENIQTYFKGNTNIRQIPGSTDKGVFLPGINNKYTGEAPDAGAFETGENWQTGHDFASRPNPRYEKTQSFYRNYLKNASFEYSRYKTAFELEPLFAWQATGLKNATVEYFEGYNFPAANTRYAIHGNSVHLSGNGTDGIVQTVNDLKPNTEYTFAGYARLEGADDVVFRVTNTGTKPIQANAKAVPLEEEQKWHFVHLKFRTGPHNKKAIVAIEKVGSGDAYVDDCGVMPVADFSSK